MKHAKGKKEKGGAIRNWDVQGGREGGHTKEESARSCPFHQALSPAWGEVIKEKTKPNSTKSQEKACRKKEGVREPLG